MSNNIKPRGGKRQGAGRKLTGPLKRKEIEITLPPPLITYVKAQEGGASKFIEQLIVKHQSH